MIKSIATSCLIATLGSAGAHAALHYALGENDAGAANGVHLNATTNGSPGPSLTLTGVLGFYSNNVPAGGSTLSAGMTGNQIYGDSGGSFLTGIDLDNFAFGFDAMPISHTSFHIAMTVGSNLPDDGAGGNLFIYHAGTTWNVHSNGVGNFDSGLPVTLNQWQSVRYERTGGVGTLYVNGVASAAVSVFPAGGEFKDAFSIGGNRNSSIAGFEGGFIGNIDNVYLVPEPSTALLAGLAGLGLLRRRRS